MLKYSINYNCVVIHSCDVFYDEHVIHDCKDINPRSSGDSHYGHMIIKSFGHFVIKSCTLIYHLCSHMEHDVGVRCKRMLHRLQSGIE